MGRITKAEQQRLEYKELLDKYNIKNLLAQCDDINNKMLSSISHLSNDAITDIVNANIANSHKNTFNIALDISAIGKLEITPHGEIVVRTRGSAKYTIALYGLDLQSYQKMLYPLLNNTINLFDKEDYNSIYNGLLEFTDDLDIYSVCYGSYHISVIPKSAVKIFSLSNMLINKFTACGYKVTNIDSVRLSSDASYCRYIITIENPAMVFNINTALKRFINDVENTNTLQAVTNYDSIDAFFEDDSDDSYSNNEYIDIITADTKLTLIRLEKANVDNKKVYKFIVDVTADNGDTFNTKTIFYTRDKFSALKSSTVNSLKELDFASFYKYMDELEQCYF